MDDDKVTIRVLHDLLGYISWPVWPNRLWSSLGGSMSIFLSKEIISNRFFICEVRRRGTSRTCRVDNQPNQHSIFSDLATPLRPRLLLSCCWWKWRQDCCELVLRCWNWSTTGRWIRLFLRYCSLVWFVCATFYSKLNWVHFGPICSAMWPPHPDTRHVLVNIWFIIFLYMIIMAIGYIWCIWCLLSFQYLDWYFVG